MKREEYVKHEEVGNIEKIVFVIFEIYLKQSKRKRKLMATYY